MSRPFPAPETRHAFYVSYGETDGMQVAYYGEYFHFFERARGQFIRERGASYRDVEAKGVLLPVVEANCRYRKPLRYDDPAVVRCGISEWGRSTITFVYEIHLGAVDPDDAKGIIATGHTVHACVNAEGRPIRVPDWLKALFGDGGGGE